MKEWKDDKTLITLIKAELYTAVIGDIMERWDISISFSPLIFVRFVMIC